MPSLTRNPDDELIRRLVSLESRVQGLETRRSRPAVMAGAGFAGGQSLPTNSYTALDMNAVLFDPLGMVDLAANTITVPHAGVYSVTLKASASGSQTSGGVDLLVNGVRVYDMGSAPGPFSAAILTVALSLGALDVLSAEFHLVGGASTLLTGSFMFATRVSD